MNALPSRLLWRPSGPGGAHAPRWSPDGVALSYRLVEGLGRASLCRMPADGGSPVRLVAAGSPRIFNEGWSAGANRSLVASGDEPDWSK
jgi:hypothetical protein